MAAGNGNRFENSTPKQFVLLNKIRMIDYSINTFLENKNIDAVVIGTPDHWHCLNLIDSLDAPITFKCNVIFPGLQENEPLELQRKYNHILFVGSLDWKPNEDSLIWFVNNVFHILKKNNKNIKFIIVGQNPTPLVKSLNKVDGIEVKGFPMFSLNIFLASFIVLYSNSPPPIVPN